MVTYLVLVVKLHHAIIYGVFIIVSFRFLKLLHKNYSKKYFRASLVDTPLLGSAIYEGYEVQMMTKHQKFPLCSY